MHYIGFVGTFLVIQNWWEFKHNAEESVVGDFNSLHIAKIKLGFPKFMPQKFPTLCFASDLSACGMVIPSSFNLNYLFAISLHLPLVLKQYHFIAHFPCVFVFEPNAVGLLRFSCSFCSTCVAGLISTTLGQRASISLSTLLECVFLPWAFPCPAVTLFRRQRSRTVMSPLSAWEGM